MSPSTSFSAAMTKSPCSFTTQSHGRHLLACRRYIQLNPVRASMVATPDAYGWSSYKTLALGAVAPLLTPHAAYRRNAAIFALAPACAPCVVLASNQSDTGISSITVLGDPGTVAVGNSHTCLITDAGTVKGWRKTSAPPPSPPGLWSWPPRRRPDRSPH